MHWMEIFGYLGAVLTLATFSMKTMLRLRMIGIAANVSFITYGLLGSAYPVLLLHLTLLPLNIARLHQLHRITREIREASSDAFSADWLKPFARYTSFHAGQVLYRRGDMAKDLLFLISGRFRAVEADVALHKGEFIGELGLVSTGNQRTQTVVCEEGGDALLITYDEVRQLYFQNPKFGFFFLELVAKRLMHDAGYAK